MTDSNLELDIIKGHFEIVVSKATISHELRRSVISTSSEYQVRLRFPSDNSGNQASKRIKSKEINKEPEWNETVTQEFNSEKNVNQRYFILRNLEN